MTTGAIVDGEESDVIAITDSSVLRGDGCFEAIRSYSGRLYALGWHIDRLERSAAQMDLSLPDRDELRAWCERAASSGDGVVRVLLTRGDSVPGEDQRSRCVVMHTKLPDRRDRVTLAPVTAPWHAAGRWSELAGAKTLSYAPNLAATRSARVAGFDDALLVADSNIVLEGPTFAVAWVIDGVVETPTLDLFILDSITRRTVLRLAAADGQPVHEGEFPLDRLELAEEVMAMSTVKEIVPVVAVGKRSYAPGPVTARLASRFVEAVEAGWGD